MSRRDFLQRSLIAAPSIAALAQGVSEAQAQPAGKIPGGRPNILILMCDEMRFPVVYESAQLQAFRAQYLRTQNFLRANGASFQRHYAASVACTPSRTSLYTGHYPSLHGCTQTTGAAKESFEPDMFWLDPASVPTMGDYFRAAGYETYWRGKWHASDADMLIPGTHSQVVSYDANGVPKPQTEALYQAAGRLDQYGFSGWIGPEPHGSSPLNSGSSVPPSQQGRDQGFAAQTCSLIQQLNGHNKPWLIMSSFVNPHDITLWGLATNLGILSGFDFHIEDVVPQDLFDPVMFHRTSTENLANNNKPAAQVSYQQTYDKWMQPILDDPATLEMYYRYYYQLHKNVDEQMMTVLDALLASRFRDNTIVIFTSDHGDLLGSHGGMHQKWYTAYDEAIRVPLIIWNQHLFPTPRTINNLTSHVDLLPTLLGLAGYSSAALQPTVAQDHSDALPLVGRDLSPLLRGEVNPASVNEPLYFMTDDDPSRGLDQDNWTGVGVDSVVQPNHLETVIANLNGSVWKLTRYFDNPQFWSSPGTVGTQGTEDVVALQADSTPTQDGTYTIPYTVTVKHVPVTLPPPIMEMYNVSADPLEQNNLSGNPAYFAQQTLLLQLLQQQRCAKRLTPQSGSVPGQPSNC